MATYAPPPSDERTPPVSEAALRALGLLPGFAPAVISAGEL